MGLAKRKGDVEGIAVSFVESFRASKGGSNNAKAA
jgi:hypothetical protein